MFYFDEPHKIRWFHRLVVLIGVTTQLCLLSPWSACFALMHDWVRVLVGLLLTAGLTGMVWPDHHLQRAGMLGGVLSLALTLAIIPDEEFCLGHGLPLPDRQQIIIWLGLWLGAGAITIGGMLPLSAHNTDTARLEA